MSILTMETKKYLIKIDNFEGPLDLLCFLIDKNKMDIKEIKIQEITDQYIEYLNSMEKMNLEIASEFLVMASTLLYLKSKTLLPKQEVEEEEITEEELINRIIEYKKYKEITKTLKENYEEYSNRIFKMQENIEFPKRKIEKDFEKDIISKMYKNVIEKNQEKVNVNAKNIEKIAIVERYNVADKVKEMYKILNKDKKFVFNKIFTLKKHETKEVVTAFSGLLELSRRSKVVTNQEKLFGDIIVEKIQ